jgi:hypothetical protein
VGGSENHEAGFHPRVTHSIVAVRLPRLAGNGSSSNPTASSAIIRVEDPSPAPYDRRIVSNCDSPSYAAGLVVAAPLTRTPRPRRRVIARYAVATPVRT